MLIATYSDSLEKLPPVMLEKSTKPRYCKNVKNLPCIYKSAWMTSDLFVMWLKNLDNKIMKTERTILLFKDACPAHLTIMDLKNVGSLPIYRHVQKVSFSLWTVIYESV